MNWCCTCNGCQWNLCQIVWLSSQCSSWQQSRQLRNELPIVDMEKQWSGMATMGILALRGKCCAQQTPHFVKGVICIQSRPREGALSAIPDQAKRAWSGIADNAPPSVWIIVYTCNHNSQPGMYRPSEFNGGSAEGPLASVLLFLGWKEVTVNYLLFWFAELLPGGQNHRQWWVGPCVEALLLSGW